MNRLCSRLRQARLLRFGSSGRRYCCSRPLRFRGRRPVSPRFTIKRGRKAGSGFCKRLLNFFRKSSSRRPYFFSPKWQSVTTTKEYLPPFPSCGRSWPDRTLGLLALSSTPVALYKKIGKPQLQAEKSAAIMQEKNKNPSANDLYFKSKTSRSIWPKCG